MPTKRRRVTRESTPYSTVIQDLLAGRHIEPSQAARAELEYILEHNYTDPELVRWPFLCAFARTELERWEWSRN